MWIYNKRVVGGSCKCQNNQAYIGKLFNQVLLNITAKNGTNVRVKQKENPTLPHSIPLQLRQPKLETG
jgi:hypothetical protein